MSYQLVKPTCIHRDRVSGKVCGAPARTDGPHGWLCPKHDAIVARYGQVQLERRQGRERFQQLHDHEAA